MKLNLSIFISLILLLLSSESRAQLFEIEITDYGGIENFPLLKNVLDQKVQELENEINEENPYAGPQRMMEGMADSSVMASKGIGKDYASYMNLYLIGVGAGIAADLEPEKGTDSEISGAGAATGFVAGTTAKNLNIQNFGGLDTKRLGIYANFGKYGQDHELKDSGGVATDLRADLLNLGLHFKYDWISGSGDPMWGWGGVKLHWGYDYNRTKYVFTNDLDVVFQVSDGVDNINGRITGKPKYEIFSQTHSIPLEASSDIRFLNIFTFYGGIGTDINYGKAEGSGLVDGEVTPLICTGSGVCGGSRIIKAQVKATADADGRVNPIFLRGFAGFQLNIPHFRIFVQADKAFGTELIAASAGLRFVY